MTDRKCSRWKSHCRTFRREKMNEKKAAPVINSVPFEKFAFPGAVSIRKKQLVRHAVGTM